jgi:hypothetical protein
MGHKEEFLGFCWIVLIPFKTISICQVGKEQVFSIKHLPIIHNWL